MSDPTWTHIRIELLTDMWNKGHDADEIATVLDHGITRHAVLGKAHRLNLPLHVNGHSRLWAQTLQSEEINAIPLRLQCTYIEGNNFIERMRKGESISCGKKVQLESSYCPEHHAICWIPAPRYKNTYKSIYQLSKKNPPSHYDKFIAGVLEEAEIK